MRDADMPRHRNAGANDRLDILGVVFIALAFHHFGISLVHEAPGIFDSLFRRDVEAPIGHVDHAQPIFRSAVDGLRHHHNFVEADRDGALVAEQNHAPCIGDAKDIHAEPVGDDGGAVVIGGELRDRLALLHLGVQRIDGNFFSRRRVCHD
jgi:hypothetical protein